MSVTLVNTNIRKDYLLEAYRKAEHYDVIKELLRLMFEAENIQDFFEAQQQLKRELKFTI